MRVIEKTEELYGRIEDITHASFFRTQRPSCLSLHFEFDHGDIFVDRLGQDEDKASSYAIVSEQGGQPFIWSIATDPLRRQQGLAAMLLREIIGYYRDLGKGRIDLTVHIDNPAQKLYFDHGFRVVRAIPRYYGEESGLRMRRLYV